MSSGENGEVWTNATNDNGLSGDLRLAQVDSDSVRAAAVAALDVRLDAVAVAFVVYMVFSRELSQRSFGRVRTVVMGPVRLQVELPALTKAALRVEEGGSSEGRQGIVDVVGVVVVGILRGAPSAIGHDDPAIGVAFSSPAGLLDRRVLAGQLNRLRFLFGLRGDCRLSLGLRALGGCLDDS